LELYFNDSVQTVYARGGGSQQRECADGADVVFTDTVRSLSVDFANQTVDFVLVTGFRGFREFRFLGRPPAHQSRTRV